MKTLIVTLGILASTQALARQDVRTLQTEASVVMDDLRCTTFAHSPTRPITEIGSQVGSRVVLNFRQADRPQLEHNLFSAAGCDNQALVALGQLETRFGFLDKVNVEITQLYSSRVNSSGNCTLWLEETVAIALGEKVGSDLVLTSSNIQNMGACK